MNRLLQHFVDSNGAPSTPASRPSIPIPPQSSGGSNNLNNRGSYQRAAPGGPFYYQPSHWQSSGGSGLEEIPLTSQSSGGTYETVDLNTDTSQHLFSSNRRSSFQSPGSTESAAELFSSGPPPVKEFFVNGDNPYRRSSKSVTNVSFGCGHGGNNTGEGKIRHSPSQKEDPFATLSDNSRTDDYKAHMKSPFETQDGQKDPFSTHTEENRNVCENGTLRAEKNVNDSLIAQPSKDTGYQHEQRQQQSPCSTADPFASAPSHSDTNLFEPPALLNDGHERMPSADSLFGSPDQTNNGNGMHPAPFAPLSQPASNLVQAQELFSSEEPSASCLFGAAGVSTTFQARHRSSTDPHTKALPLPPKPPIRASLSSFKSQEGVVPSPANSQINFLPPSMKPPVNNPPSPMNNALLSPMKTQAASSASPAVKPEDPLTPVFGSMKLSVPAEPSRKSGLDVRHMKFPAGKREDDAISNAPSIAQSRMSMRSTLDDSLKLSDMYKQMTARLEGEKHELLKVVAGQAQEIAHMKKQIKSLELQLKKYEAQDV
ncbi:hypothetical protein KXD40_005639 [Peronospora effusa]|uniref:Uncharacterized protein n=1 Tax=Peronospora effusa TaxID=542832 RepID=A0A3M6VEA4_9STRA|nr:hypothetical protein DD238_005965 [Peronospora effusa]RQM14135.1 hypothetical protein DD237_006391 [Peronospora effusa]UIZ27237.1 hypothetical protein KXD40_005639 [Peronospora effusa]CAI5727600.1 unnamed protein product [Peronospora effusa]